MGNLFCAVLAMWAHAHVCMGIKFDMGVLNMSGVCSLYCAAPDVWIHSQGCVGTSKSGVGILLFC